MLLLLYALISFHVKLQWYPQVDQALQTHKKGFTSIPIVSPPDLHFQFMMEMDASDVGTGAVISQHSLHDNMLPPCAFLPRKLSPRERNYDVGSKNCWESKWCWKNEDSG